MSSRKSYRNKMVRKDLLEIHFHAPGGAILQGRLLDVHSEGAAVLLSAPGGFSLEPGAVGELQFSSDALEEPFKVIVDVRSARRQDASLRVGFRFSESLPFQHRWPRALRSLSNRRGAYRVRPRAEEDVRLVIRITGRDEEITSVRGQMMDISLTGLRARLDEDLPWANLPAEVRVSFIVPGTKVRVMISGQLRNTYGGGDDQVGVQFYEDDGSARFGVSQREIREYIMQRQREELRRMSWTRTPGDEGGDQTGE
jgi:hypothetical protein